MGRPRTYAAAALEAQAAYDNAVAHNEAAWAAYDAAARDPQADYRPAWLAYSATLVPLDEATAALSQPEPKSAVVVELGQLTLFSVDAGAAHAA